jgi:hypothetical protein
MEVLSKMGLIIIIDPDLTTSTESGLTETMRQIALEGNGTLSDRNPNTNASELELVGRLQDLTSPQKEALTSHQRAPSSTVSSPPTIRKSGSAFKILNDSGFLTDTADVLKDLKLDGIVTPLVSVPNLKKVSELINLRHEVMEKKIPVAFVTFKPMTDSELATLGRRLSPLGNVAINQIPVKTKKGQKANLVFLTYNHFDGGGYKKLTNEIRALPTDRYSQWYHRDGNGWTPETPHRFFC